MEELEGWRRMRGVFLVVGSRKGFEWFRYIFIKERERGKGMREYI